MLSAYYDDDGNYGYETFAYDYANSLPDFLEYNKYDKKTGSFLHMHSYMPFRDDEPYYEIGYGKGNKYFTRETLETAYLKQIYKSSLFSLTDDERIYINEKIKSVYDILRPALLDKKKQFFGSEDGDENSDSIMAQFITKDAEIKATYTDGDGQEKTLQFENNYRISPEFLADDDFDANLLINKNDFFRFPIRNAEAGRTFSQDKLIYYRAMSMFATHDGVDFLSEQNAFVRAVQKGVVSSIDLSSAVEGTVIRIKHYFNSNIYISIYKGLSNQLMVAPGDVVEAGQVIGLVGNAMIL